MKIMCQEHYDEVVRYAERIGDKTLEERLNDLKRWERNPNCPCEIELYKDSAPYSFLFRQRYADGSTGMSADWFIMAHPIVRDVTANRESAAGKFIREMRILI